ncbi:MAG: NUDIX domain-containing protein [Dehalococcoidales bacterium]|nr:NUDIX domain-containing protein [Dehalococcoidales bacterium]
MITEHSAGAIVFREENGKIFYLILHYEEGHWGYPKGHIENRETIEETAGREIREETGLTNLEFLDGFKEQTHYFYHNKKGRVFKTVTFLLPRTSSKDIKLSFEHTGYEWLPFEEALEKITFKDEKQLLQKARSLISEKGV